MKRSTVILSLLATTAIVVPVALSQPVNQYVLTATKIATALGYTPASAALTNTHILVGNGSNIATDVALSGDATLANTGAITLGTIGVAKGGTGLTTLTANNVILGNGTSTPGFVAPGTSGNVLSSDGNTWASVALASSSGLTIGTTGITNGTTTRLIYDLAGVVSETAGITYTAASQNTTFTSTGNNTPVTVASGTITALAPAISATQTWNNSGVTFNGMLVNVTDTASSGSSTLIDLKVASSSKFRVIKDGTAVGAYFYAGSGGYFAWSSGSVIANSSDGVIRLMDAAEATFGRLQLGGTTSSFPALKRSGTTLIHRLADDSADGPVQASTATLTALANTATTSAVCYNTGTGVLTYNSTVGTCTVSTIKAKDLIGELTPREGLDIVMSMEPQRYELKKDMATYTPGEQIGFVAEHAIMHDPRLVAVNPDGSVAGFKYEQYTAALTAAFQYLKADNDNMREEINSLKRAMK